MLRKFSGFFIFLLVAGFVRAPVAQTLDILVNDMWNYYKVFSKLKNDTEREDLVKQMECTADKILEYYKNYQNPDANQMRSTAEAFLLLAIIESETHNPTRTYHALKTVKKTNWGVVESIDPSTNRSFKEQIDGIDTVWLPKFKKCSGQVYGFPENMIWDTLGVETAVTYLDVENRTEGNFKAIKGAQEYLNSQIREGSKEVTLLLPEGKYELESRSFEVYPTRFEVRKSYDSTIVCEGTPCTTIVKENPAPTIFDVTPNEYFNLRVFYCRDSIAIKIDTVVREVHVDTAFLDDTSHVYRRRPKKYENYLFAEVETRDSLVKNISHDILKTPIEPKDLSIWKGNKQILDFDHLAFGVYELRDAEKFGITDEYTFKRFLPEGIKWDMPRNEKFKAEDIFVRSGDNYDYCIDLFKTEPTEYVTSRGKPTEYVTPKGKPTREWCREFCKKCRCRTVWDAILVTTFMGAVFGAFMYTINK
jgi:hypothetical protein